ncbi:MAG TPA: 16S rRNA (guanine(966)-N(2))-methyltransferase RsmD [Candidatus Acidoferrum sp.]|nr:16S rRNA (guanine(966)-N(2))-methyltransferase RsmD [Candidatus Acidoferrum sp.]
MRVIAGKFRSRRLKSPGKLRMRPTSDRLRETLFNVLGPAVKDSLFVDLYAGTGAIGIEAISRGAREVILVESHAASAKLIRENLKALEIKAGAEVIEGDAVRGLEKIAQRRLVADLIFLDPPYKETEEHLRVLEFLDSSHLVASYGVVIVEHSVKLELPDRLSRLERTRLLEQGDAALSFYRLAAAA